MVERTGQSRPKTPAMEDLVAGIREIVARDTDAEVTSQRVASLVGNRVGEEDLLTAEQREASGESYTQHVVHVEEGGAFSVVSLVWLAGEETPIHDHVCWCVPAVHEGKEREVHFRGISGGGRVIEDRGQESHVDYLVEKHRETNQVGDVTALTPPGDIHRVWNPGPEKAISIHVYGADIRELGSSIRRCYEQPVRQSANI